MQENILSVLREKYQKQLAGKGVTFQSVVLAGYLEQYKQERGYLLTFNFNKGKQTGISENIYSEKRILEVVV